MLTFFVIMMTIAICIIIYLSITLKDFLELVDLIKYIIKEKFKNGNKKIK